MQRTTHVKEIARQIGSFPQILQGEISKNLLKPPPTRRAPDPVISYKWSYITPIIGLINRCLGLYHLQVKPPPNRWSLMKLVAFVAAQEAHDFGGKTPLQLGIVRLSWCPGVKRQVGLEQFVGVVKIRCWIFFWRILSFFFKMMAKQNMLSFEFLFFVQAIVCWILLVLCCGWKVGHVFKQKKRFTFLTCGVC